MTEEEKQKYFEILDFEEFTIDLFGITSISIDELCDLFHVIGVQNSIDYLLLVLDNFVRICDLIPSICKQSKWLNISKKISDLADTARVILHHQQYLGSQLNSINAPRNKKANDAFYGMTTDAPLYVTLGFLPEDRSHLNRYDQLVAQIFIAIMVLIDKQQLATTAPILIETLVEIRRTARDKNLSNQPAKILDPESFYSQLLTTSQQDYLKSTRTVLSAALSNMTTTSIDKLAKRVSPDHIDPILIIGRTTTTDLTSDLILKLREEKHHQHDDHSPTPEGFVYFLPTVGASSKPYKDKDNHLIAQQIAGSRAMEHQLFENAWDILNQNDITIILNYLFSNNDCNDRETISIKVAIGFMLFAGFSPARIISMEIAEEDSSVDNVDCCLINTGKLRIITPGPSYTSTLSKESADQAYPIQHFIDLDLPIKFVSLMNTYLALSNGTHFLATLSASQINRGVNSVCAKLKYGYKKRLYPARLQKYLQGVISRLPYSDISVASTILGKELYLARTAIHYAAFDVHSMNYCYKLACQQMLCDGGYPCEVHKKYPTSTNYLGTRLRPQTYAVTDLVDAVLNEINIPVKRFNSITQLANYHNAYTLYTWMILVYSSAYRGVNIPYITQSMYDEPTGLAVIRDKDSYDCYHSRLVWLSECCLLQLKYYRKHIQQILSLSSARPKGKASEFFFLDPEDGSLVYPSRGQITAILKKFNFHLPPNVQRHFLKSEMQEDDCGADVVELLLGHWCHGQEGWVETSAVNPCDYRDEVQKYQPRLLRKINLIPIAGIKNPPNLELPSSLDKWSVPVIKEAKWTIPEKTLATFNQYPPSYIWNNDQDYKAPLIIEELTKQQLFTLSKIRKLLPELYSGTIDIKVNNDSIKQLLHKLTPKNIKLTGIEESISFFINGLERGKKELNWVVEIPHRPIVLPKGYNRIRPAVMIRMEQYRRIEEAFIADLEQSLPNDKLLQLGQVLISAILYGGINHPVWAEAFWTGLTNGWCYQWQDIIWIDLWADKRPNSELEQWDLQRNAAQYRRWLADPLTQLLLNRINTLRNGLNSSHATTLSQAYSHYAQHVSIKCGTTMPDLKKFLKYANAWSTLHVPPFLSAYMENKIASTSLPDPVWLRILTGKHYPRDYQPRQVKISRAKKLSSKDGSEVQIKLIKKLCLGLSEREMQPAKKVILWIESFLEDNGSRLCCCCFLLAKWAIQLLSYRQSPMELRQKKPERISTTRDYVGTIYRELLTTAKDIDLFTIDEDEFHDLLAAVLEKIGSSHAEKTNNQNPSKRLIYTVDRLNQFLGFIHVFHDMPLVTIKFDGDDAFIDQSVTVRANLITMAEFERLKQLLGWCDTSINREQRMAIVWAILAFRCGLRVSEIYGLMISDLQGDNKREILVQPNKYRELKSTASQRRIPIHVLLPKDELDFVIKWQLYRKEELGSHQTSPLFTSLALETLPCPRDKVLKILAPSIKQATGDITVTVHCLRHSFASWLLVKLLKHNKCPIHNEPAFLQSEEFSYARIEPIEKFCLANDTLGRKALYLTANLLGHANTETELTSYMHLCDLLCWHHLRHPYCLPPLTALVLARLTGGSKANAYKIINKEGNYLADYVSKLTAIYPAHPLESSALKVNPIEKNIIKRNLEFDEVFHQTYKRHDDYYHWPKSAAEVKLLRYWYDALKIKYSDNELHTNAQMMIDAYKRVNRSFEFYEPQDGKKAIDLLESIGAECHCLHYPSRWKNDNNQDHDFSLRIWEKELGRKIYLAKSTIGRAIYNGKLTIQVSEINDHDLRINCDPAIADLIYTLLLCLT